jgi:hypothetical protein
MGAILLGECRVEIADVENEVLILVPRSLLKTPEIRISVDLGELKGKPPGKDVFHLRIKNTGKIRMETLRGYLQGSSGWDDGVLECVGE